MPLASGEKLGPYEILSALGAGGMGEVYKARDTRLDRTVAIKVSKEHFSERFEREARAVAALNHPNICHLYDVGPNYLVMEFVDGEPLHGPMPLAEALRYANGAREGDRPSRPETRQYSPDARRLVKVLDFGLAKVAPVAESSTGENSPTISMAATQAGIAPTWSLAESDHALGVVAEAGIGSIGRWLLSVAATNQSRLAAIGVARTGMFEYINRATSPLF